MDRGTSWKKISINQNDKLRRVDLLLFIGKIRDVPLQDQIDH